MAVGLVRGDQDIPRVLSPSEVDLALGDLRIQPNSDVPSLPTTASLGYNVGPKVDVVVIDPISLP